MITLGIESSAKVAGAAVWKDGQIVGEQMVNGTLTHSETLMPMIDRLLRSVGIQAEELTAIALSSGPGSFTGLRIGAATAKGLALGLGIPLVPVPTLEALAFNAAPTDCLIVPMMDARRSQVYAAVYAYEEGRICEKEAPDALPPAQLASRLSVWARSVLLLGDGAQVYESTMRDGMDCPVYLAEAHLRHARAAAVAALGARRYMAGKTVRGSELRLDYLRKPQAEREREERMKKQAEA